MGQNAPEQNIDELKAEITRLKSEIGRCQLLEDTYNRSLAELQAHQEELRTQNEKLTEAHQRLSTAHAKYFALFDHAPIGYFLIDRNGLVLEVNLTAARWLGQPRDYFAGKPLWLYLDNSQRDQFHAMLRALVNEQPAILETILHCNEQEQFPVELHGIPAQIEKDEPIVCQIAVIDVSRRKTAEKELRNINRWLDSILKTIPDIVYRLDHNGYIKYINEAVRRYGFEPEELLDQHYLTLIHQEDRAFAPYRINERRTGNRHTKDFEIRLLARSEARQANENTNEFEPTFSINASGLYLEDGEGMHRLYGTQGIAHDITTRKLNEQMQLELKEQLQRARRMEAIGTLAGGIAHDFNNIMTGIQGSSSLLQLLHPGTGKTQELLKVIEKCMVRGKDLTRQLLGYARGGKYVVKSTNLNALLASSLAMFNPTQKNIEVTESLEQHLWNVQTDHGQMEQVFLNMFINAGQAMPEGGTLRLLTSNEVIDADTAKTKEIAAGNFVRIVIEDTGTGMDKNTSAHIFEPFFTTKPHGSGTGLGLASAYGIIKNHAGSIQVNSRLGKGTSFEILLPADPEQSGAITADHQPVVQKGKGTILVVDDEQVVLEMVSRMLTILGYRVKTASSGEAAITLYEKNAPSINLVILDILMPGMSGFELYDRLRQIKPEIKVIFSSGYSSDEQTQRIFHADNQYFLQKPFPLPELSELIGKALSSADPAEKHSPE